MITCVIPTRDETTNLPRVMATVRWCDEIIVVDMESTDGTPELARSLGARVIGVPQNPVFDMSRKVGMDAARNDWVLALDADEMVPPSLAEELGALVRDGRYDAALLPRLNFKLGCQRGSGLWPDYQRRLYRRDSVEFVPAIHDYLRIKSPRVKFLPPQEDLALHHFNYIPAESQIDKLNKYTSMEIMCCDSIMPFSLWRPLKTFVSLHFKHGGWREEIPGLWWSAQMGFYVLVQGRKQLELRADRTMAKTEGEVERLNRESSAEAHEQILRGCRPSRISTRRFLGILLAGLSDKGTFEGRGWAAAFRAFHVLARETKAWEMQTGRAMAERAQDEARARLMEQWGERSVPVSR